MPQSREEVVAELLREYGHDPRQFDIDDSGRIVPREGYTAPPEPAQSTPGPGALETFFRSAVGELPETAGSLIGAGLGAAGGTAIAPASGPLAVATPIAGALGGSFLGGSVGHLAEEEFLPPEFQTWQNLGAKEHPFASFLGRFIPQLVTSNPARAMKNAIGLARATPTLTRFTPQQLGQIANLGIGTSVGAAGQTLAEGRSDEGFTLGSIPRIALATAAGALMSEPNKLGRMLSLGQFKESPPLQDQWSGAPRTATSAMRSSAAEPFVEAEVVPMQAETDAAMKRAFAARLPEAPERKLLPPPAEAPQNVPAAEEVAAATAKAESDANRPPEVEPKFRREDVLGREEVEDPGFRLRSQQKQLEEPEWQPIDETTASESEYLAARRRAKRSGIPQPTREQPASLMGSTSPEWDELIKRVGSRFYGADVETGGTVTGAEGKPVAGRVELPKDLERALVQISKNAGIDTGPHELLHLLLNDVAKNGTPAERRFAEKVLGPKGINEEMLAQEGGQEFVRRLIDEHAGKGGNWLGDMAAFIRSRYLNRGTPADFRRLAANTLRYGAGAEQYRPGSTTPPAAKPPVSAKPPVQPLPKEGEKSPKNPNLLARLAKESHEQIGGPNASQIKEAVQVPSGTSPGDTTPLAERSAEGVSETAGPAAATQVREQPLGPTEVYGPDTNKPRRQRDPMMGPIRQLEKSSDVRRQYAGDIFRRLFSKRDAYRGKYSDVLYAIDEADSATAREAYDAMVMRDKTGTVPPLSSPESQALYDKMSDTYAQMRRDQIAAGHRGVGGRTPGLDPMGMFNQPGREAIQTLITQQGSPRWQQLKDDFINLNQQRGMTLSEAESAFQKYIDGVRKQQSASGAVDFGPVSLPENTKLPTSWINPDPFDAWERYIDNFTRARAWHDVVTSDPGAVRLFEGETSLIKDPDVVEAFNSFAEHVPSGVPQIVGGITRVVYSSLMGPISRLKDLATTPFKALGYTPITDWPGVIGSLTDIKKAYMDSRAGGLNKPGGNLVNREILGAHEAVTTALDKGAKIISKHINRAEDIEIAARTVAQAAGNYIGGIYKARALAGDTKAVAFLQNFGSDWRSASTEELGTRIARLFQGNYDARNLPKFAREGPLSPFFSLGKWSIEQYNNFRQFAIEPARKGDYAPLVRTIVAHLLGGAAVSVIPQLLTKKKPYVADIEEIKNAPDPDRKAQEITFKLGSMLQSVGFAGILSDMFMMGGRAATGRLGTGPSYPAGEVAIDTVNRGFKAAQAILSGVPTEDVLGQLLKDLAKRNVQIYQILTRGTQEREEANATRDFRMFRRLSGENDQPPVSSIDYSRSAERAFDKERDVTRARERGAALTQTAHERFGDDFPRLRQEFDRLRTSRNTWMPANLREREAFLEFLRATQGQEKARSRLEDYERAKELQREKRFMIGP